MIGLQRDALGVLHVDQERGEAVPAVLLGRLRGAEERDQVVGPMRIGGPDLGAVDQVAAVDFRCTRPRRKQIRARIGLAHADAEAALATADARQDIHLDILARILDQRRPRLAVGREEDARRRIGHAKLFRHNVALEEGALLPAVFLGPGQSDPTLLADLARKLVVEGLVATDRIGVPRACRNLGLDECADLLAQVLALFRQSNRIKVQGCRHRSLIGSGIVGW